MPIITILALLKTVGNCFYEGCTVPVACNYDPAANSEDDSCEYESCAGCINPTACNYDPIAIISGDCTFSEPGYDCEGDCLNDTDSDGICDELEISGCTDAEANNYDSSATDDDGDCEYTVLGCTDLDCV